MKKQPKTRQTSNTYFEPKRKVKLGSIEKDKDIVMDSGKLMCMWYEGKFKNIKI